MITNLAEELFKEFKSMSVGEFFRKNDAMLGYTGKIRSLTTIIHESVTNGIDAAEEAGVLPDIYVVIEELGPAHLKVIVEDNAAGIPEGYIPEVFGRMLAGSKAHRNIQSRGQQGIGISGAVMFSQTTTGQPVTIVSSTGEKCVRVQLMIDLEKNIGKIVKKEYLEANGWRGTRIEFLVKDVLYNRSKYGVYNYLRHTALANPHTRIILIEPDDTCIIFDRAVETVPDPPKPLPPHPNGVIPDDILRSARTTKNKRVASFLQSEFSRVSSTKLAEIKEKLKEVYTLRTIRETLEKHEIPPKIVSTILKGVENHKNWLSYVEQQLKDLDDEKRGQIIKKLKQQKLGETLEEKVEKLFSKNPKNMKWEEAELIVEVFKRVKFMAPPTHGLNPIGEENIIQAMKKVLMPSYSVAITRRPATYRGGIPFIVEVGLAYGGHAGEGQEGEGVEIVRFANRAPLLFDRGGCVITETVKKINWKRYNVDINRTPMTIFCNIVAVHIPYTSAGKQAIAAEPEIAREIKLAIEALGRKLRRYINRMERANIEEKRLKIFEKYFPIIAEDAAKLAEEKKPPDPKPVLDRVIRTALLELRREAEKLDEEEREEMYALLPELEEE